MADPLDRFLKLTLSTATDGVCEQNTFTRHIFSCLRACGIMSHTTLAQGVSARHTIHVSCACLSDISSTLSSHSSFVSPIFYLILLDRFGVKPLCTPANEESAFSGPRRPSHTNTGLWSECGMITLCLRTSTNAKCSQNAFVEHNVAVKLADPSSNALGEDVDNVRTSSRSSSAESNSIPDTASSVFGCSSLKCGPSAGRAAHHRHRLREGACPEALCNVAYRAEGVTRPVGFSDAHRRYISVQRASCRSARYSKPSMNPCRRHLFELCL